MFLSEIESYVKDYITNCGFPVSDWDVGAWSRAARDYMDYHGIDSCDAIPGDVWTDMAMRYDVSGVA